MVGEPPRNGISEKYRLYLAPIVDKMSGFSTRLIGGLESILSGDHYLHSPKVNDGELPYESRIGPETKDGDRYSTEEILDMPIKEFVEAHKILTGSDGSLLKYFNAVRGNEHIYPDEPVRRVIEFSPKKARYLIGIGETTINRANQFMEDYYGISLGTYLDPPKSD